MDNHHQISDIVGFCRENWQESDTDVHRYILHLHRLSNVETQRGEPLMAQFGLSMTEFDLLATLRRAPAPYVLSPTQLQRSTLLSSGGLTKLLYQLEERQLVSRSVDREDKRSKLVHLTPGGKKLIEKAMTRVLAQLSAGVEQAGMSKQELKLLIVLMGKLLQALEGTTAPDQA